MNQNQLSIILVEPQQPDNVAAIARVMASFGFNELILVNPLLNIKDIRPEISRGGTEIIDNIVVENDLLSIRERYDVLIGTTAKISLTNSYSKDHIDLEEMKPVIEENTGKIGLVFGREDRGMTNEEMALCNLSLRINTSENQSALNLSHAAAIILHSASQIKRIENSEEEITSPKDKEKVIQEVLSIYELSSKNNNTFLEKRKRTHEIVWRRLLTNSLIKKRHMTALLGFLNEIKKSLDKK